jgi:DNA repair protein RadC
MQVIDGGRARLGYDAKSGRSRADVRGETTAGEPVSAVKALHPRDRPREKLARSGVAGLGDNEVIAVLLGSGVPAHCALALAGDVLMMAGGVVGLSRLGFHELQRIKGIGESRAARLVAAVELGRRVLTTAPDERTRFTKTEQMANYLLPLFGGHPVERFGIVFLDAKGRLIRATILSSGSLDTSIVHPREVFREAMVASAAAIVAFHNHPSGDPSPSPEDRVLTHRLVAAGEVVGIRLVDHIILGDGRWFSFREATRLRSGADSLEIAL